MIDKTVERKYTIITRKFSHIGEIRPKEKFVEQFNKN